MPFVLIAPLESRMVNKKCNTAQLGLDFDVEGRGWIDVNGNDNPLTPSRRFFNLVGSRKLVAGTSQMATVLLVQSC